MQSTPKRGILFVATGPEYLRLAVRAARSARAANPGVAIDLATDQPERPDVFDPDVFDVVRPLAPGSRLPKLHAMPETRFEQTLYLDADLFVLANIEDVFLLLDRFDIAMAHDQFRNSIHTHNHGQRKLFNAFPQYNSGVVAFRRTERVLDFLTNWRDTALTSNARFDQPVLRELLWESDLRIATLPWEYNLMNYRQLRTVCKKESAPRILHHPHFHTGQSKNRAAVSSISELLRPALMRKLQQSLEWDREIRSTAQIRVSASDIIRECRRWLYRRLPRRLRKPWRT